MYDLTRLEIQTENMVFVQTIEDNLCSDVYLEHHSFLNAVIIFKTNSMQRTVHNITK